MTDETRENFMMRLSSLFDLMGVRQVRDDFRQVSRPYLELCIYSTRGILSESGGLNLTEKSVWGVRRRPGACAELVVYTC